MQHRAALRQRVICALPLFVAILSAIRYATVTAQPPEASAGGTRGKIVYVAHCVECHGAEGKGDGPASHVLNPRPRDFTTGKYKIRSTEGGSIPTDDDLLQSVRQGLYGTAMPGWEKVLSPEDIHDVVAYIKGFSPRFAAQPPQPLAPPPDTPTSADAVARGRQAYEKLQCAKCHGEDGRGTNAAATDFVDDWGQPLSAANLTEPWTFRGGATARDIYMRLRAGMSGTPMPSFKDAASDTEMLQLADYVVSLARKPVWQMTAEEVANFYAKQAAEAKQNPVRRGKYLVRTLGCVSCHSPLDSERRLIPGLQMAGGLRIRVEPFGDYPTGNLTADKETGLGNWTDEEIKRVLTRGILRDGTRLLPYPMDWGSYSTMSSDDLSAIVAYLRTVPAIRNKVPPPIRTLLPLYLWGKFKMLVLGSDPPMVFYPGNAAVAEASPTDARRQSRNNPPATPAEVSARQESMSRGGRR